MAVVYPAFILKVASISTGRCSGSDVGYLKVTLLNVIASSNLTKSVVVSAFLTSGSRSMTSKIKTPNVFAATMA
jgi:hypothetical protein